VKSAAKSGEGFVSQAGFTLTELLVVLSIIGVVAGLSIPSLFRTIDNTKLKGATQRLAAVYQDARMRATENNTSYEVLISAPGRLCLDLDGDGRCGPGEPVTWFPRNVSLNNSGVPAPLDVPTLGFPFFNTENSVMHDQRNSPAPGLAWNGLGMPCQRSSATSPCVAAGWVQYLQLQRASGDLLYAAVTVSPTGRIRTWTYISSGNGNGSWL
jgi:prepilin-type N-terminal cleavage/methylation domain-containing protein